MKDPLKDFMSGWNAAKSPDELSDEPPAKGEVLAGLLLFVAVLIAYCLP